MESLDAPYVDALEVMVDYTEPTWVEEKQAQVAQWIQENWWLVLAVFALLVIVIFIVAVVW